MNSVKLNTLNKTLMNIGLMQSRNGVGRAISTAFPPLLNQRSTRVSSCQLPAAISSFVGLVQSRNGVGRAISTAFPPLLNQRSTRVSSCPLPAAISSFVGLVQSRNGVGRAISTAFPPLLNQRSTRVSSCPLPAAISTFVGLVQSRNGVGRAISTAFPPLLNQRSTRVSSCQLPTGDSIFVRHYRDAGDDPSTRYGASPVNLGVVLVPEKVAYVVERFRKYRKILTPGFNKLNPLVDRIAYVHFLKEHSITIPQQSVVTKDGVKILIDALIFVKVLDPWVASYDIHNPMYEVTRLAQNAVLREVSKITAEKIWEEVNTVEKKIAIAINEVVKDWGLICHHFKLLDMVISPSRIEVWMEFLYLGVLLVKSVVAVLLFIGKSLSGLIGKVF